jgi:TolB-like protein/DNA-binding winged helix-turn-helix (wHTH) protein
MESDQRLRFGAFEVDRRARELRKLGMRIKLEDQPFEILLALVEKPSEVVTRTELQARLWPDGTFVDFEKSLTKAVNKLRTALGDSAATPRYVETLSRRGYRMLVPVEMLPAEPAAPGPEPPPPPPKPLRRWWAMALAGGALAAALFGLSMGHFQGWPRLVKGVPHVESLAVLPIQNLSGDPAQDVYADGLTDALTTSLARIGSLRVISHTSAMRYKGAKKTAPEIARELNVDGLVEGSVALQADRAQIRLRLVHGPSDQQLWSESYDEDASQRARLQVRIALEMANQVSARVSAETRARIAGIGTVNPKAFDAYLRGRALWNLRIQKTILEARTYFEEALRQDPTFALAYAGMADTYIIGSGVKQDGPLAEQFAYKALAIDPNLAEAYVSLAFVYQNARRYADAERQIRRALELGPGYMMTHQVHSIYLLTMGRLPEALEANGRGLRLDPFSWPLNNIRGYILINQRRDKEALQHLQFFTELQPKSSAPAEQLARLRWIQEDGPQALAAEREAFGRYSSGDLAAHQHEVETAYKASGVRGACLRAAQLREQAFWLPDGKVKGGGLPMMVPLLYASARKTEKVLELLEKRLAHPNYGDPMLLKTAPELDYLRDDPRFRDLLRRYGLPE